jgi:hypothetical protein
LEDFQVALTPAQLSTEIATDPMSLGLVALANARSWDALAAALNLVRSYQVYVNNMTVDAFIGAAVPADFLALTSIQLQQLTFLFSAGTILDGTNANIRSLIPSIFAGKNTTLTNFAAIGTRLGSRVEVLGGIGTVVSAGDCHIAATPPNGTFSG